MPNPWRPKCRGGRSQPQDMRRQLHETDACAAEAIGQFGQERGRAWLAARPAANHERAVSQPIKRASHAQRPTVHHMKVDHRRPNVPMAEELLNRANVVPVFEQVSCEGVPFRISTDA